MGGTGLVTESQASRGGLAPGSSTTRASSLGAWLLGFAPVAYLGLTGAGYDVVVRGRVGILACWLLALGAIVGLLPRAPIPRLGWLALGLLVAFGAWTLLSTGWSPSIERSVAELGRVAAYIGIFAFALAVLDRALLCHLGDGIAAAVGLVALIATLSRLYPNWFAAHQLSAFFPGSAQRLDYPVHYANGLGEFVAIGLPLTLGAATRIGSLARRAIAAALLPVMTLCIVLTVSRGGVIAAGVGVIAFLALAPDRLAKLASVAVAGVGASLLVLALLHRHDLRQGLSTALADDQGHQLALLTLGACLAVGLAQVGIAVAERIRARNGWLVISPRRGAALSALALVVALVVAVATGVPGRVSDEWGSFRRPNVTAATSSNQFARFTSASGSNRYQYWQSAVEAFDSQPLHGIGAGTFEYWWARTGPFFEFIRNAHSLYLETLAELGIVGLLLIAGFLISAIVAGARLRVSTPDRLPVAAALAGLLTFAIAAGYDWLWQLAAAAGVALLLAAGVLSRARAGRRGRLIKHRAVLAAIAAVMTVAMVIPMATTVLVRRSEQDAHAARYAAAIGDTASAERVEPYAASPALAAALVFEQLGRLHDAAVKAAQATNRDPRDWRTWLIRARITSERGQIDQATSFYARARSLNPRSPVFVTAR